MHVRIASEEARKLVAALNRAGSGEIGGQLFGEQLAPSRFRVTELTIQRRGGSFARFVVDLVQAARDAFNFFQRTERAYVRFNYVGEWHSHPSFEVKPSGTDADAMRGLVRDPAFKGTFAVLMIVRCDSGTLTCGAWVFDPQGRESEVELEVET